MAFEKEASVLRFMQGYGDMLLSDIAADEMIRQPTPAANHPAWIVGHMAYASDVHVQYAGGVPQLSGWSGRFGRGSMPSDDPSQYPGKDELFAAWHAANNRLIDAVQAATPEQLGQPTQGPLGESFPTVGDFFTFLMTGHTSLHLGQLSAWRRAMGKPHLF